MKIVFQLLFLFCVFTVSLGSPPQDGSQRYEIDRDGEFDESTEKLIRRFERLRYGMTLKDVKKLFPEPEQARWGLHSIDRHYAKEFCFQWQEDVFFCFSFLNRRPWNEGDPHFPDDESDDWLLECAAVVREHTKVENGQEVVVQHFNTPRVAYHYQKPRKTQQGGADQPATAPGLKPEGDERTKPESEGRPQ